jgi:hypothetical protein
MQEHAQNQTSNILVAVLPSLCYRLVPKEICLDHCINLVPGITHWFSILSMEGKEKPVIRLQRHPLIDSIFNHTSIHHPSNIEKGSKVVLALPSQGGTSTSST